MYFYFFRWSQYAGFLGSSGYTGGGDLKSIMFSHLPRAEKHEKSANNKTNVSICHGLQHLELEQGRLG